MSWFPFHRFVPDIDAKSRVSAVPPTGLNLFSRVWARRMVPTTGGQNWSLATQELPRFMLSGPFDYIARPFRPLEPALPHDTQQVVYSNAYATGMVNGQFISAPLVGDNGQVSKALIPVNNKPFNINGILPAGKV